MHYFALWPWPLTFDLEHLLCIASDVIKLCTKFERNQSICGGVIAISVFDLDLEHVWRAALGSEIIFTKFDLRQLIHVWIIAFLCLYVVLVLRCDLDLWPVDLESSWYIKRHVIKVCTKFERNRAIPGWIIDNCANFCTRYITQWPWLLTYWPGTFAALRVSCV